MSPASILRQFLLDQSLGTINAAWPIFVSLMQDTPDNCIVVYDTAGEKDGRIMFSGEVITRPGVQVRVRGITYTDAQAKARAIADKIDLEAHGATVGTLPNQYFIQNISRRGDILPMGAETENNRTRFNFTVNAVITYSLKG